MSVCIISFQTQLIDVYFVAGGNDDEISLRTSDQHTSETDHETMSENAQKTEYKNRRGRTVDQ